MEDVKLLKEKLKSLKVLFVDDEQEIRDGTGMFLEKFFNEVTICKNGKEGLEYFVNHQDIQIIISDIIMPNMNGIEMIKEIKKINSNIFVVFISASRSDEEEAISLCNAYVKKPLSYNDTIDFLTKIKESL